MIILNSIKCKKCGMVLVSKSVHDFNWCKCGECAVDGGYFYLKRAFRSNKPDDSFEELSIEFRKE